MSHLIEHTEKAARGSRGENVKYKARYGEPGNYTYVYDNKTESGQRSLSHQKFHQALDQGLVAGSVFDDGQGGTYEILRSDRTLLVRKKEGKKEKIFRIKKDIFRDALSKGHEKAFQHHAQLGMQKRMALMEKILEHDPMGKTPAFARAQKELQRWREDHAAYLQKGRTVSAKDRAEKPTADSAQKTSAPESDAKVSQEATAPKPKAPQAFQEKGTSKSFPKTEKEKSFAASPGVQMVGEGVFGRAYLAESDGKKKLVKYGGVSQREARLQKDAADLGVAPRVLGHDAPEQLKPGLTGSLEMEYLEDHKNLLAHLSEAGVKPGSQESLPIFKNAIDQMASLHLEGIAHRDLHMGNIMVGPGGSTKLIDFGVASEDPDDVFLELTGTAPQNPHNHFSRLLRAYTASQSKEARKELGVLQQRFARYTPDSFDSIDDGVDQFYQRVNRIFEKHNIPPIRYVTRTAKALATKPNAISRHKHEALDTPMQSAEIEKTQKAADLTPSWKRSLPVPKGVSLSQPQLEALIDERARAIVSGELASLLPEIGEMVSKAMNLSPDELEKQLAELENEQPLPNSKKAVESEGDSESLRNADDGSDQSISRPDKPDEDEDVEMSAKAMALIAEEIGGAESEEDAEAILVELERSEKALGGLRKYIKRWKEKGIWRYLYPGDKKGHDSKKEESASSKPDNAPKADAGMTPEFRKTAAEDAKTLQGIAGDKGKVEFRDGSNGEKFGHYFTPKGQSESVRIGSTVSEGRHHLDNFQSPKAKMGDEQNQKAQEANKKLKDSVGMKGEIKYKADGDDFGYYYHPPGGGGAEFLSESNLDAASKVLENRLGSNHNEAKGLSEKTSSGSVEWHEGGDDRKEGFHWKKPDGSYHHIGNNRSDARIALERLGQYSS